MKGAIGGRKADSEASVKCESLSSAERDRLSLMEALQFDRAAHETTTRVDVQNRARYKSKSHIVDVTSERYPLT